MDPTITVLSHQISLSLSLSLSLSPYLLVVVIKKKKKSEEENNAENDTKQKNRWKQKMSTGFEYRKCEDAICNDPK